MNAEDLLAFQLTAVGIEFARQYLYVPGRKFRADFAHLPTRLLVHVDGGIFSRQAHGSVSGILADIERLNLGTLNGWRALRVTPQMVSSGEAYTLVERAIAAYGETS